MLIEERILAMLGQDDADGLGYTTATIAFKLWGPPHNPLQATQHRFQAEALIESLLEQGKVQIASYMYLKGGRIPRYKLLNPG